MSSITGAQIRAELKQWGIIKLLGTTTALGSQTGPYLTDTERLKSTAIPSGAYDGCAIRFTSGTDGDPEGLTSYVDNLDFVNGNLYFSPAATSAIASGVTYEIYRHGVDPDDVDRCRDKALTKLCSQWVWQPLSEITNSDYEDALSSSNWTGQSSATLAVQTLGFPSQFARYALRVTNSGANGYARSASLYTRPTRNFYLYIPVSAITGTAELIVRDVTNSANITLSGSATTVSGRGWTGIEVTGTIPAACYEIQLWLRGQGAADVVDWGPVNFHWKQQQYAIGLPDRVDSRKKVGDICYILNPMEIDSYNDWGEDMRCLVQDFKRVPVGDRVRLEMSKHLEDRPYYFQERVFYSALSTDYQTAAQRLAGDAATTRCPLDYVVAGTARLLAELYVEDEGSDREFWASIHARARVDLQKYDVLYGAEPKPIVEKHQGIRIPMLRV